MRSKPRNFERNIYDDLGVVKSTRYLFLRNLGGSYVLKHLALVITDKKYVMILPKTTNVSRLLPRALGELTFQLWLPSKLKKYMESVKFIITWVTQLIGKSAHPLHKDRLSSSINCLWFYEISPYIVLNCRNLIISWSFRWTWWILCLYKLFLYLISRKNVWAKIAKMAKIQYWSTILLRAKCQTPIISAVLQL